MLYCVVRCSDEFFAAGWVEEEVVGEVFAKSLNEGLVVFRCVEFFCTEKLVVAEFPCAFEHFDVEDGFVFGWNVFEECEHSVFGMFISERVKDESVFCDECVSIHWNPNLWFFRKLHREICLI